MWRLDKYADLEVSIIRATRINKVLKRIIRLDSIPKDEKYNFRRRSIDILGKWKNLLDPAAASRREREGKVELDYMMFEASFLMQLGSFVSTPQTPESISLT